MTAANRDEANRCVEIAKAALASQDRTKALRFIEKAIRLGYPSREAHDVLNSQSASSARPETQTKRVENNSEGLRKRGSPATSDKSHEDGKASQEQRNLVISITRKTCYYEILGLQRNASDDDIKRAYRKLALKLHPDKNKARGADDAFKSVSKAFSCLSNPDKRRNYDAYGAEDPALPTGRPAARHFGGRPMYYSSSEIDPEEIFNMFFGGNPFMASQSRVFRTHSGFRPQQQGQAQAVQNPLRAFIPLVPFFLIFVLNLFSRSGTSAFSLSQSKNYADQLRTLAHEVPYYVASHEIFAKAYPGGSRQRAQLEAKIESEYREALQSQCYQERMIQQRYKFYGHHEKAKEMPLRACDELVSRFEYKKDKMK